MDSKKIVTYPTPPYPEGWAETIDQIGRGETTSDTAAYVALEYDKLLAQVERWREQIAEDRARIDALETRTNRHGKKIQDLLEKVHELTPADFRR